MPPYSLLNTLNLGFLGCGSIAQNFIRGYLRHKPLIAKQIFISGRNLKKISRISEKYNVTSVLDNEELLEKANILFLCLKPTEAEEALDSLNVHFQPQHTILSLMAGVSFQKLKSWGVKSPRLARLMPNISVSVGKGFLPFCTLNNRSSLNDFIEELLSPLGKTLRLKEEALLSPSTVGSSSGLAFILELMEYWLEWLQGEGFSYNLAKELVIETFLGAAELCKNRKNKSFSDLQKEILSPKGVTFEGLQTIREMELERILRLGFEKAHLKVKNIANTKKA